MNFTQRIKQQRLSIGKTLEDVAVVVGVSKATVQRWESGEIQNMRRDKIAKLATALNTTPSYLMGWVDTPAKRTDNSVETESPKQYDNIFPVSLHKIPFLGEIACGQPIFADEERESYVMAGTDIKADFCLRCHGDSMIDARINDGDIVFIREMPMVDNGDIAAVIIDDCATLKRVYYYPASNKLMLAPANPAYEPLMYVGEELDQIHILGRAIAFQSDL